MKRLFFSAFLVACVWGTVYVEPKSIVIAQTSLPILACDPFGYNAHCPPPIPSAPPLVVIPPTRSIKDVTNFATLFLASSVFALHIPWIAHFFRFLGSLFAFYKKKNPWGIVVDSDFGKPIRGVRVQAFDSEFHQLKETQVTDVDGQFDFALSEGRYSLILSEAGFLFPARKKPPITLRNNERIYLGEEFAITRQGTNIFPHLVVPMDIEARVAPSRAVLLRVFEQIFALLDWAGFFLLFLAAAANTYFVVLSPDTLNIICEVLYLVIFFLQLYLALAYRKGVGVVRDSETKETIGHAVVRIYNAKTNRIVQTRVANKKGVFSIFIPNGDYTLSASCQGYETLVMSNIHVHGGARKAASLDVVLKKR